MSDKLTEALDYVERRHSEHSAEVMAAKAARRWASFPTDTDVDMAEAAYVTYLYEHSDPLADVVDTRHAAFRAALEAVKREDR